MNLLDRYKIQQVALSELAAKIAQHKENIRLAELEARSILTEAVDPTSIVADALDNAGIENYYFLDGAGCGAASHPYGVFPDSVRWGVIINGETCDVRVNLLDGVLIVNGHKIEAQNLEYA